MNQTIKQNIKFDRDTGQWQGVVMIERPNLINLPLDSNPMCNVMSARTVQFKGERAIFTQLPYNMLKHYFKSSDGEYCFVKAEFKNGHLELYEGENLVLGDWVLYSMTPEQKAVMH